jgi:protein phosphatase
MTLNQANLILLLAGVAIGILIIFILIAFILLPLSKRVGRKKQKRQADIPTQPAMSAVKETTEAEEDDESTFVLASIAEEITIPTVDHDTVDTVVSPTNFTVGDPLTLPTSGIRPANIGWQVAALTDVGLKRELNEDNLMMIEGEMAGAGPYGLYVVADGLGGHEAGEVASQLTVNTIQQHHANHPPTPADAPYEAWLKSAIIAANEVVLKNQKADSGNNKMGSTLVMALVVDHHAHIINVGDSRAYRLNSDIIEQISIDHSLVERLVQIGQITRDEARTHKQRNVIYSIIGEKEKLEIGYYHVTLQPGDRLLLCSDGLSGMVTDEKLLAISRHEPDPARATQTMILAAKQGGGHDNITAIIVQMPQI